MKHLELDGQTLIAYRRIEGNEENPTLVFLHEGLGCSRMWKGFPDALAIRTGCPALLYDRPGYGKSSPIAGTFSVHFMHRNALCELPKVLDALLSGKRYILIGHSDGGSIALIHAGEHDPNLIGVITEAAHVFVEKETRNNIRSTVEAFQSGKLDGLARYHGEKTGVTFTAWSDIWLSEGFALWNIETVLPAIECPTLVIQGRQDPYGTLEQVERIISGIGANAEPLILDSCEHIPHRQQEGLTLNGMARFIHRLIGNQGDRSHDDR